MQRFIKPINRSSEVPAVEGGEGLDFHSLFLNLIAVSQSHEGVDDITRGSVVSDDLPAAHSVDEGGGAVAVLAEQGVGGAHDSGIFQVVPVLFLGVGVEDLAVGVGQSSIGFFDVDLFLDPFPAPVGDLDAFPSGGKVVSET